MAKWSLTLLCAAVGTAISACAVGPDYQTPSIPVEKEFQKTDIKSEPRITTEATIAHFWTRFNDAQLNQLIDQSLTTNHDLRIALANWQAARALRRNAQADHYPVAVINGGREKQQLSQYQSSNNETVNTDLDFASLDTLWELDVFGRVRRNVEAQQANETAVLEDLRAVQVSVIAEVANNYMALRGAQQQLVVTQRNAQNQQQALVMAETMETAGRGTQFDTVRARALLNTTRAAIGPIESDIDVYVHRLAVLSGQQPAALNDTLLASKPWPELPALTSVGSPETLLRRRPDIRAAERRLAMATAAIGVAQADWFPKVTFIGEIGFSADSVDEAGNSGAANYRYGPSISWSVLDFAHIKARVQQSEARQVAAAANYEKVVLGALEETENSLSRYAGIKERLKWLESSLAYYQQAVTLAHLRYEGGSINFLEVLDAERQMLAAEDAYTQTRTAAATSIITIYKSLGGGWQDGAVIEL